MIFRLLKSIECIVQPGNCEHIIFLIKTLSSNKNLATASKRIQSFEAVRLLMFTSTPDVHFYTPTVAFTSKHQCKIDTYKNN